MAKIFEFVPGKGKKETANSNKEKEEQISEMIRQLEKLTKDFDQNPESLISREDRAVILEKKKYISGLIGRYNPHAYKEYLKMFADSRLEDLVLTALGMPVEELAKRPAYAHALFDSIAQKDTQKTKEK